MTADAFKEKKFCSACPCCEGTGRVPDSRLIGAHMRREREAKDITVRRMAKMLNVSAAYVSDLERGNRQWNQTMKEKYLKGLEEAI